MVGAASSARSSVPLGAGRLRRGAAHDELGQMVDSSPLLGDRTALRRRLDADGYLYMPKLLSRSAVLAGRRRIVEMLTAHGWEGLGQQEPLADDGSPPTYSRAGERHIPGLMYLHERLPSPQAPLSPSVLGELGGVAAIEPESPLKTPEVAAVVDAPELHALFEALLECPAVHALDYRWLRIVPPAATSSFHVDHCFFHSNNHDSGERGMYTAWLPWCDTPVETGGLAVLRGSNSLPGFARIRETYGDVDVSYTDIRDAGPLTHDPHWLLGFDPAAQWLTADYRAGDVLVFTMQTFHGAVVNSTGTEEGSGPAVLRMSSDIRFLRGSERLDGRYSVPRTAPRSNMWPQDRPMRTMEEAVRSWAWPSAPAVGKSRL